MRGRRGAIDLRVRSEQARDHDVGVRRKARRDLAARSPGPDPALHPPLTSIRWAAVVVGGTLASTSTSGWTASTVTALGALAVTAALGTWWPVEVRDGPLRRLLIGGEVALGVVVATSTGYWLSPFVFSLIAAVGLSGFIVGFRFALVAGAISTVAVTLPFLVDSERSTSSILRLSVQWGIQLALAAGIAGYARRLSREAEKRHSEAMGQVGRLTEANQLLASLHEVAQDLPASLDLEHVLDATVARLRSFWDLGTVAILVPDETSERWIVARQEGVRLPIVLAPGDLPPALRRAARSPAPVSLPVLGPGQAHQGLSATSGSGVYAPLHARGALVGLVAAERTEQGGFARTDMEVLQAVMVTAALALDNARWFSRLRTIGADAERSRIARDLHDRVGQSLAAIAFELERLSRHSPDEGLRPGIDRLRGELRRATGEMSDALGDLRIEVTAERDLVRNLDTLLARVERRSGTMVHLHASDGARRLPLPQEQEMWHVAQEAIMNAERHGRPNEINVSWWCDGSRAELQVVDDGSGFTRRADGSHGTGGMLRMRERAASMGAVLSIDSAPGRGTSVRCAMGVR